MIKCKCDTYYTCKLCRTDKLMTYEEIGKQLGVSRQMVQHIEKQAIKKFINNMKLLGYNSIEEVL